MSVRSSFVAIAVVVGLVAVAVSTLMPRAVFAQSEIPNTVEFIISDSTIVFVTNAPNDPGDVVVFTGKPVGVTDAGACSGAGPGLYPVYNVVVIDPGFANRATRFSNVIVASQMDPVKPGTKLGNIQLTSACNVGTQSYTKYRGTVQ